MFAKKTCFWDIAYICICSLYLYLLSYQTQYLLSKLAEWTKSWVDYGWYWHNTVNWHWVYCQQTLSSNVLLLIYKCWVTEKLSGLVLDIWELKLSFKCRADICLHNSPHVLQNTIISYGRKVWCYLIGSENCYFFT